MEYDQEEIESYESLTTLTGGGTEQSEDRESTYKGVLQLTREMITEAQKELGLIKLCWPEVDLRQDLYLKTLPGSYCTLSGKEKVLAWYTENFRQQFLAKHPKRKPLLLVCDNECGVQVSDHRTRH